MSVRKIAELKDINELHLDGKSASTVAVHGYTVSVLITAARCGELEKLRGIGKAQAERITRAIDEAGFILPESEISQRIREMLAAAFYFPLGAAEEYEARVEFSEQQRDKLFEVLDTLTAQEAKVLKLRFGLSGAKPMTLREAAEILEVSHERVRYVEADALRKLRHPARKKALQEIFPGWPGFEMAVSKRTGGYDGPVEEMPIAELPCLSVRAYNCLVRAGIDTIGKLIQHTYAEVMAIRNMRVRDTENVVASLLAVGCELKTESKS